MPAGRPRKPYFEVRDKAYRIRLTKVEKLMLEQVANLMECEQADVVREALELFYGLRLGLKAADMKRMIVEDLENGQV